MPRCTACEQERCGAHMELAFPTQALVQPPQHARGRAPTVDSTRPPAPPYCRLQPYQADAQSRELHTKAKSDAAHRQRRRQPRRGRVGAVVCVVARQLAAQHARCARARQALAVRGQEQVEHSVEGSVAVLHRRVHLPPRTRRCSEPCSALLAGKACGKRLPKQPAGGR